ncbi:MAG: glutaredoxin domain-containing protein [Pseudomonadota bacterium]
MRPKFIFILFFFLGVSCKQRAVETVVVLDAGDPIKAPKIIIADGHGLLFTFFDHKGDMQTVNRLDGVPDIARAEVMVTDPQQQLPNDQIYVVDLRKETGQQPVCTKKKGDWLARVMPKSSQLRRPPLGKTTKLAEKKKPRRKKPKRRAAISKSAQSNTTISDNTPLARFANVPKVLLFTTSWCPSCKAAIRYFQTRGVPFLEFDVEKDPRAAQQYALLQRANGLREGVVPLIVINGRVFQGFSPLQVGAALTAMGINGQP